MDNNLPLSMTKSLSRVRRYSTRGSTRAERASISASQRVVRLSHIPQENRLGTLDWREHTAAWGWQMWTPNMGTGAVSVVINSIPYDFRGKHTIGTIFVIINIIIFIINVIVTSCRMYYHPKVFMRSFSSQSEGVWFPTFNLACATLLLGFINYGIPYTGPWFTRTCEALFWIYIAMAYMTGLIIQNTLRLHARDLSFVAPAEALEVFPTMIGGTVASILAPHLSSERALVVILFGYVLQGGGFWMGILKLAVWQVRHITLERARSEVLPSYIIALGPPGFTALAFTNLGYECLRVFPETNFLSGVSPDISPLFVAQIFAVAGILQALFLLGWCVWILVVFSGWSTLSFVQMIRKGAPSKYSMSWWAWTFPLSGFISTLGRFATLFPSKTFAILNIIGTIFVFIMWMVNVWGTVSLILDGQLPVPPRECVPNVEEEEKTMDGTERF